MASNTRTQGRMGVIKVSEIVEVRWECGWQEYNAVNDDAIDGIILMRRGSKRPVDTGGIVFVQVKCGNGYLSEQKQYPGSLCINVNAKYIQDHRPRWKKMLGPVVMIFVDNKGNAWWADLNKDSTYSPTNKGVILIDKKQKFSSHSKSEFHKLCGSGVDDRALVKISMNRSECMLPRLGANESLRNDAWSFYKNWRDTKGESINPKLGLIFINRSGWKHITRPGRLPERIVQSWMLLGAAKKIVRQCENVFNLGHASVKHFPDGNICVSDYLGLRAMVSFPFRHESVIQVVLRRSRLLTPLDPKGGRVKVWFHSVYELRRNGFTNP